MNERFASAFKHIREGDHGALRQLLDLEPDLVSRRDESGASLAHAAIACGAQENLRLLLERGAAIEWHEGCPPVTQAIRYGTDEIVRFLIAAGYKATEPDLVNDWPPVVWAVALDRYAVVGELVSVYPDGVRRAFDDMQSTLLHIAAVHNSVRVARLLVKMGAPARAVDRGGLTPCDIATRKGFHAVREVVCM